jgi:HAD superfamily hydrolase (TIGR01549 family)
MKRYFSPKTKKVIFFDLNDTLIDQKQSFRSCLIEVLNDFTGRWDSESRAWDPQQAAAQYEKEWSKLNQSKRRSKISRKKKQFLCLRESLKPYPFIVNDEFAQSVFKRIKQEQPHHLKLYPDVIKVLSLLGENYKLGIISNKKKVVLQPTELASIFSSDHVITAQQSSERKPSPALFKYALKTMKVKADEAVMVGNSWKQDIYGATRSGIDAVWIYHAHKKKRALRKIGKERVIIIRELKTLLDVF